MWMSFGRWRDRGGSRKRSWRHQPCKYRKRCESPGWSRNSCSQNASGKPHQQKDIAIASSKGDSARPMKRSTCVSLGPYDSRTHSLFCGTVTMKKDLKRKSDERIFYLKTYAFVKTILVHCKTRGDECATAVQSRIEYFGGDLYTADSVYYQPCSINFCTLRNIPRQFTLAESTKRRKSGRPKDSDQDEAFESVCEFLEENDEE